MRPSSVLSAGPGAGWHLRSRPASGTRCALEHGGAAPVIIAEDASLNQILPSLMKGAFYHAGQVCVSVQRIFAQQSIAVELARRMRLAAEALIVGDPLLDKTEVGPLIRRKELERVEAWVNEAVSSGAQLLCGGEKLSHNCYARPYCFV